MEEMAGDPKEYGKRQPGELQASEFYEARKQLREANLWKNDK